MNQLKLEIKLILISLLLGTGLIVFTGSETYAILKLTKPSHSFLAKNNEKNYTFRARKKQNTIDRGIKNVKSSSQRLVGGWTRAIINDSGGKDWITAFFDSDGSWFYIATRDNGYWYVLNRGTWRLSDGILYQTTEERRKFEGPLKFLSNNEFTYRDYDNSINKWTKISSKQNLSASQLIGTWSIVGMKRVASVLTRDTKSILKLVELNESGTFRYESARVGVGVKRKRLTGTWEYTNSGYGDGFLILKSSQGKIVSVGSIDWTSKENFLHIHRSQFNRVKNQYSPGRIERFSRTKNRITRW